MYPYESVAVTLGPCPITSPAQASNCHQSRRQRTAARSRLVKRSLRSQGDGKVLAELELHRKDQYVSWFGIGLIHDALGEKAPARAAVQRAFEDRAVEFALAKEYPPFRTIASDPAYLSIVRQVGLSR